MSARTCLWAANAGRGRRRWRRRRFRAARWFADARHSSSNCIRDQADQSEHLDDEARGRDLYPLAEPGDLEIVLLPKAVEVVRQRDAFPLRWFARPALLRPWAHVSYIVGCRLWREQPVGSSTACVDAVAFTRKQLRVPFRASVYGTEGHRFESCRARLVGERDSAGPAAHGPMRALVSPLLRTPLPLGVRSRDQHARRK